MALRSRRSVPRGRVTADAGKAVIRLTHIKLSTDVTDDPKWQQVAEEGDYKGYAGGEMPFSFTRDTFTQIVANFRAHPAFVEGDNGVGTADVVQWDFHHSSEVPPATGTIATLGAPAMGWALDLQVRDGAKGAELWALTRWIEPAKTYIKNGQYKWASVAVALQAVDPRTGMDLGPVLTSIAITNTPFIEGMQSLAANKGAQPRAGAGGRRPDVQAEFYGYAAKDEDDARGQIRQAFGLPLTATADDIKANLAKLLEIVQGGEDAEEATGIDADKLLGQIRTVLGMPLLTDLLDVAQAALSLFEPDGIDPVASVDPNDPKSGESTPGATTQATKTKTTAATAAKRGTEMDPILIALAKKLGVRETPEAVQNAVSALLDVRGALVVALTLSPDVNDERLTDRVKGITTLSKQRASLFDAVTLLSAPKKARVKLGAGPDIGKDGDEGSGPKDAYSGLAAKLEALFAAGGVEDPSGCVNNIMQTLKNAEQLETVMPELSELRKAAAESKTAQADEDVAMAKKAYFSDDSRHEEALRLFHTTKGRKTFLEKYPRPEGADYLLSAIASVPGGGEREITLAAPTTPSAAPAPSGNRTGVVDLSKYPGMNDTQRALAALIATEPGSKDWSYDDQMIAASERKRSGQFVNLSSR